MAKVGAAEKFAETFFEKVLYPADLVYSMTSSSDEIDERIAERKRKNDCFREVFQAMHITEEDYMKQPHLTQIANQQVSELLKYRDAEKAQVLQSGGIRSQKRCKSTACPTGTLAMMEAANIIIKLNARTNGRR